MRPARPAGWRPIAPQRLPDVLADYLASRDPAAHDGVVRVALDGPPCAEPLALAHSLAEALRALGRSVTVVDSHLFRRDASVRLEHGREDVESYPDWLDHGALQREVLVAAREHRVCLTSLRDPVTNRSTRVSPAPLPPDGVVIVAGELLLGRGLDFDVAVHLAVSASARARRTPGDAAWTLPAFDSYDEATRPSDRADVVVKLDDPVRPALRYAR